MPYKSSGAVVLKLLESEFASLSISGVLVQISVFVCKCTFLVHGEKWIGTHEFEACLVDIVKLLIKSKLTCLVDIVYLI